MELNGKDSIVFETLPSDSSFGKKTTRFSRYKESLIKLFFTLNGLTALIFIILIFIFLFKEGIKAFSHIGLLDFIYTDRLDINNVVQRVYEWYPTSELARYSLVPLLGGTLLTAIPATIISTIFGVAAGIYLSEIAHPRFREFLKPAIELFAAIPTVVIGFIMLAIGATFFQELLHPSNRLNAFVASMGLSIVIIPIIASLTEDALRSIPVIKTYFSYAF
jgi:phosphate transport system permease protein